MPGGDGGYSPKIVSEPLRNLFNGGVPQNLELRGSYGVAAASLPVGGCHQAINQGSVPVDSLHRGGCRCSRQHVGGKECQILTRVPTYLPKDLLLSVSPNLLNVTRMTKTGGCGDHYSQKSLVGEIHPQKGHLRVSRGLLHKTIQPSPQSVFPLPAFRPRGVRLQGRVCQVQALLREPRDRTLSPKEGGKSGGCNKVRKLSGPSSCFQHEVPQAERGGKDNCGRPGGAAEAKDC